MYMILRYILAIRAKLVMRYKLTLLVYAYLRSIVVPVPAIPSKRRFRKIIMMHIFSFVTHLGYLQLVALGSTGAITPDVSFDSSLLPSQKERMKLDRIWMFNL